MFDEEPDADSHGECREEIRRLEAHVKELERILFDDEHSRSEVFARMATAEALARDLAEVLGVVNTGLARRTLSWDHPVRRRIRAVLEDPRLAAIRGGQS
jgi:hypothetical protein